MTGADEQIGVADSIELCKLKEHIGGGLGDELILNLGEVAVGDARPGLHLPERERHRSASTLEEGAKVVVVRVSPGSHNAILAQLTKLCIEEVADRLLFA